MKIVYLVQKFPKISETFVLNEMLIMQAKGLDVEAWAFSRGREAMVHKGVKELKKVRYLSLSILKILYGHFYFLFKDTKKYLKALQFALSPSGGLFIVFFLYIGNVIDIARGNPDHVHAYFGRITADMAMLIKTLTGTDYTFTTYRYDIFESPAKNYVLKSSLAKRHITVSEFNKHYLSKELGVDPDKIDVIYSGINFKREFPKASISDERNTIIFVGRLVPHKAPADLVRACLELKVSGVRFKCVIAGDGPESGNLARLIKNLGMSDDVRLLGPREQDDVYRLIASSTVLVLPSRSEGIPLVLMEAMALKVPVVSTAVSGIPELVEDKVNGFLVAPGDIRALASSIRTLLENDSLREDFIRRAYDKMIKKFNLDIETDKMLRTWQAI